MYNCINFFANIAIICAGEHELRMISKATIMQFIKHKLLQPSLYVYKLCKRTQGLFSFYRFVLLIRNIDTVIYHFILHRTYISCMQKANLMYFDAIYDSASLATLDSTVHRIIQELKAEEDQDQYQLWHQRDKLNLSRCTNSGERLRQLFLPHSLRMMRNRRLLILPVGPWIFLK